MHYRGVAAPSRNKVQEEPVVTEVPKVRVVGLFESFQEIYPWMSCATGLEAWEQPRDGDLQMPISPRVHDTC